MRARNAVTSLHVGNVGTWNHEAFREYVISHARRARLANSQAELARATGIDQGVLSRWFRGVERPSLPNLQRLAQAVPGTSVLELTVLAGRASLDELGMPTLPVAPRAIHPLADEVDALLSDGSPLDAGEQEILSTLLQRVLDPYRGMLDKRRSA